MQTDPKTQWNVGYWLLAVMALVWMQSTWQAARTIEPVPYSQFERALAEGRVAEVVRLRQLARALAAPPGEQEAKARTSLRPAASAAAAASSS